MTRVGTVRYYTNEVNSCVFLRNIDGAVVYSPFYEEGIGTIYADAVNSFVTDLDDEIVLDISTNVTAAAAAEGITFSNVGTAYDKCEWHQLPMTVLYVQNGSIASISNNVESLLLNVTAGGTENYYRIRTQLNYYGPIRFRIRRLSYTTADPDRVGLIALDNIVASYPPMTIRFERYGEDYDASLKGAEVLGCLGDFNVPFQSVGQNGVQARTKFSWVVNNSKAPQKVEVISPRFHYRWRYLNQMVEDWKVLPLNPSNPSYLEDSSATQLVTMVDHTLNQGTGDLEYFFTADLDAQYYSPRDYANDTVVGHGAGWTEKIYAVTNRASYTSLDGVPSGGTDYFVRIREGESNIEWVQLIGTLTITNKVAGSNDVYRLHTPDGTIPRMTLVGDHSWRYHYEVPTNAIGAKLSFKLVAKEYYTNETAATSAAAPAGGDVPVWLTRTNELFTVEETVTEIPYTATLSTNNPNEVSVILDESSTHLKIEYNDEQRAFALSHAAYQAFNLWTDATSGFRGNMMDENGVSNSGVSSRKRRYDAPFDGGWTICPEENTYWSEDLDPENEGDSNYPLNKWFSVHKTYHGWTMHNGRFVLGARGDFSNNLSAALDGLGEGALAMENFSVRELPLGVDTVSFTARIAQPIQYDDFATYMDGLSSQNYAISAKVSMSRQKETDAVKPNDMSPVCPSISFVGYHRGKQGCYEFRMTRKTDTALELGLYKWVRSGSMTTNILLKSAVYETNLLVPTSDDDVTLRRRTAAYFLLYTFPNTTTVKLEGHIASSRSQPGNGVTGTESGIAASAIAYVDNDATLSKGGTYGVGSTDCRAGFGEIKTHGIQTAPQESVATSGDGKIDTGSFVGRSCLENEWDFYTSRWEVDSETYDYNGGMSGVIPSNQVIEVWVSDASSAGSGWENTGYSRVVNSFTTNMFSVSPCIPGSWKVRLQTGEDEDAGVVLDDVSVTPWGGTERWGRDGTVYDFNDDWVYTKGWITAAADITFGGKPYELPAKNIVSVETADSDGYALVFDKPGDYVFKPLSDMEVERVLLVGGGGSGGSTMGGGGGGGGVVESDFSSAPVIIPAGTALRFKVGAGGAAPVPTYSGGSANATSQPAGNTGGDTSMSSGITGIPTAKGGGGGGGWSSGAKTGGSGGGGSGQNQNGANGVSGQGNAGGRGYYSGTTYGVGGGGGGAGAAGQPGQTSSRRVGGAGGDGVPSDITGSVVYYGGGGGGGAGYDANSAGGVGGAGGGGKGSDYMKSDAGAGQNGLGGGGGGGTYMGNNGSNAAVKKGAGARGGSGTVILRVRTRSRICTLQPSRGTDGQPMGIRSPYIDEGMSLFSYSYKDADTNCVMLVQVATNMTPGMGSSYVPGLTDSLETSGEYGWTTIARHDFSTMTDADRKSGTRTAFISKRQHWIYDFMSSKIVYTNVCGVIRVIVDPAVVSRVVNTRDVATREKMIDYGKITITKAYCYNEPSLDLRSWFGFNVFTSGWNDNAAGPYAFLTDWPAGLSIALNFSAKAGENTSAAAHGVGLAETDPSEVQQYSQQNPFVQSAALTNANGIGTVSFRARLFNSGDSPGVVTLYGGVNPSSDQPTTESREWDALTNFVVTAPTYQSFEWTFPGSKNEYKAIRLEAAGARWGRYPSGQAAPWEWGDLTDRSKFGSSVVQEPVNRVFIDEVSVSELIVPRLKFLDVRPFRDKLGSEEICVITNITKVEQQPLYLESWGIQCRLEPQQMADELDTESIRVWMEAYRGEEPWGYEQWRDLPVSKETMINGQRRVIQQRFTSELMKVPGSDLVFRSYYLFPGSIMPPEEEPGMVYQYMVYATFRDKSGRETVHTNVLEDVDWSPPAWYRGSTVGTANKSGDPAQFSAFTILDSISPQRAWLNELNLCDAMNTKGLNQFIELAVPQEANLRGWSIRFTDYNRKSATLAKIGVDDGVRNITSKSGNEYGVDNTNHYTFVSICAPSATDELKAKNDGTWKVMTTNTLQKGVFQYLYPYGIQLVRPSGIIEHEVVMQGTNVYSGVWGLGFEGTNLVAELKKDEPESAWFYAGEDRPTENTSLGVFRSHGEEADPSTWSNEMVLTPGAINKFKNGGLQEIPYGYFLEPRGGNVWIYSTLLKPQLTKQTLGGRELGANAVIVIPTGTTTNITISITNWYQLGVCKITDDKVTDQEIPGARGSKGTYSLQLNAVSNTTTLVIDAEPQTDLAETWGLTPENRYTPAVLAWLLKNYGGFSPDDLSAAEVRKLNHEKVCPLTLTEMYWLDIPPVHKSPISGGSNIWFEASMGAPDSAHLRSIEPHVVVLPNGTIQSNVYVTVTMMITNTVTGAAEPPQIMNGVDYKDGVGSLDYTGNPTWTSVVFSVTGALQKPDVADKYYPLQQYVFKPDSFGDPSDPNRRFQTRIEVVDPYALNSMGSFYGWSNYRNVWPIWFRWSIKDNPDGRRSIVPLKPNWTPPTSP